MKTLRIIGDVLSVVFVAAFMTLIAFAILHQSGVLQ